MDISGFLKFWCISLVASSLLIGCGSPAVTADVELPTIAATANQTALKEFVPTPATHTPSPAPTLPTSTPLPSATPITPTPEPTSTPDITPTHTPDPARQINGIPFDAIAVVPADVVSHIREIAVTGRDLGRNPQAFSKLGDSAVLVESNLTRFDNGPTTLGPYAFLQPTVDYFAGSWKRYGAGARVSLTTIGTFDPMWANPNYCNPGEHLLACEIRLHNPAVLLVRLGTNDGSAGLYYDYMGRIIQYAIENGVVPVLGTKADRFEGDDSINEATRQLAAKYRVPLWDFDLLAGTLPNRGLTDDNAHLTTHRNNDYTNPEPFARGYPMSDLSALVVLDKIREIMVTSP